RRQLPHHQHCLAVALLGKGEHEAEHAGIVVLVDAVIHLHQLRPLDPAEAHAVRIDYAVGAYHVETPDSTDADVDLEGLDLEALRPEPLRQMLWVGPC